MTDIQDKDDLAEMTELDEVEASRAPLQDHLVELRNRLIQAIAAVSVCAIGAFFFSTQMLEYLMIPFERAGSEIARNGNFIFTSAFEILFIKLRLSVLVGLAVAFPFVAWQIYSFVAPGLYNNERRAMLPYMVATPFLFAAGAALVYFMILPIIMRFAFGQEMEGVEFLPKASEYVGLALSLLTAFGLAFQTPVVMSLLAQAGIVSSRTLRKGRKYAVVGIFAMAMLMTPPDPFSQSALAFPVYLLYELGIIAAWLIERGRKEEDDVENSASAA